MPHPTQAKLKELRAQFSHFDTSGDGKLDLKEMSSLLRRGNPHLTDAQLQALFNGVDRNHDGRIDFTEFIEYIYSTSDDKPDPHAPEPPEDVHAVFHAFAGGPTIDGVKFQKLCRDCSLTCRTALAPRDVDMLFASVVPKGKRGLQYSEFLKALGIIAQKRGLPLEEVYGLVGDGAPVTKGAKAEAVRFHDDKSTYCGTKALRPTAAPEAEVPGHRRNTDSGGAPGSGRPGPERVGPTGASHGGRKAGRPPGHHASLADTPQEDLDWNLLDKTFFDYAGKSDDMDSREFAKLCADCGLFDKKFTRKEVDIVFNTVLFKGERRMQFGQFTDALKIIAQRKDVSEYFVYKPVLVSEGPKLHGTRAEAVRFHDDKSTYTGAASHA